MLSAQLYMLEIASFWSPLFYSKAYESNRTVLLSDWVTFEKPFLCPTSSLSHSLLSPSLSLVNRAKKSHGHGMLTLLSNKTKCDAPLSVKGSRDSTLWKNCSLWKSYCWNYALSASALGKSRRGPALYWEDQQFI